MGGLVSALAGRVPQRGEIIAHPDGLEFEITDADPRRIKRVRVRPTTVPARAGAKGSQVRRVFRPAGFNRNAVRALTGGDLRPWPTRRSVFCPDLLGYGCSCRSSIRRCGSAAAFGLWRGWLAGSAYFLIGCWWVAQAFLVDAAEQGWMAPSP